MKNQHIIRRFQFALAGLKESWRSEKSVRAHIAVGVAVLTLLLVTHPAPLWWALLLLAWGLMLAVELVNTALEKLVDHLHPDQHAIIGVVKDTLAAAVLVMCVIGGVVLLAFLWA
jgi:undecaprenol kinase